MNILILKTNITCVKQIQEVSPFLNSHPHIVKWSIDFEDCDKVLRAESEQIIETDLQDFLRIFGIHATDLEDDFKG